MKKKGSTKTKLTVIIGYVLVMIVMAFGLIALYNNLVDYSNKKIDTQGLSELLVVSNTLSLLYEIESEQNLLTPESTENYFQRYDSIVPAINDNLNVLKDAATDTARLVKLDSIALLVDMKRENLQEMAILLDSLSRSPNIVRQTESSLVPRELNREISNYLESRNLSGAGESRSDTSVVAGERRRFLDRVRDVFDGRADSTVVIESRSVVTGKELTLIVDTLINKVRYSERLDLERQRRFQQAFLERQERMILTNRMLTGRIDDLLKEIEQEEMAKSVQLLIDKEEALTRSEGTMRMASLIALLIVLVFGALFLVDINKSQRYRKQLEASNRRVSDLLAARERLMLTISHDIKAPMSSILGYLELMDGKASNAGTTEERPEKLDENEWQKYREYLANMQQSGEHVLQLVSTLLDHHKLESGAWNMKESNVNLRALIDETARSFEPLATRKGLAYRVDNLLSQDRAYRVDPYVMRQVMSNLLSNAIKYTPRGSVSVVAREEAREEAPHLVFSVTDTGPGIDPADQEVVFQDFKQLDGSPAQPERAEGSGLGLAITKAFVDEMKGSIRVKSKEGSGSEFIVVLPLDPAREMALLESDEHETREEDFPREEMEKIKGTTVLVIDDDPVQLKMTSEMLTLANAKVITEQYPERVLQLLEEQRFDLLFVDLQMPGIDGIALIKKIRQSTVDAVRQLPVVALSARSDTSRDELEEVGFTGFLTKPFSSRKLYAVTAHFARREKKDISSAGKSPHDSISFEPVVPDSSSRTDNAGGVQALIDFVKEDKEASLDILHSFVKETTRYTNTLKAAFAKGDLDAAGETAHTVLPLARVIGNDPAVSRLERLERREPLAPAEEQTVLDWLEEQVKEAEKLAGKMESQP